MFISMLGVFFIIFVIYRLLRYGKLLEEQNTELRRRLKQLESMLEEEESSLERLGL